MHTPAHTKSPAPEKPAAKPEPPAPARAELTTAAAASWIYRVPSASVPGAPQDAGHAGSVEPRVQKKSLVTGSPADPDEREAEDVARKVAGGESAEIRRSGTAASPSGGDSRDAPHDLSSRLARSKGGGRPLHPSVRGEMELRMRADFGEVRVHTGHEASTMAEDLGATAFAHGRDVYFGRGAFSPGSKSGKELLSHELVHTRQQLGGQPSIQRHQDPNQVFPNKHDPRLTAPGDIGARGYMPDKEQFKAKLSGQPSMSAKVALVDGFVNEFFDYYVQISSPSARIFQKSLNIKTLADKVDASNQIRGIPLSQYTSHSGVSLTNSNADWGKFKPHDPQKKTEGYASMMVLDATVEREALDLLELKKVDNAGYLSRLQAIISKDSSGDAAAALAASLRRVSDHVNRLYAVYSASLATGMPFNEITAFYGQESYFTMPSSALSLESRIPSLETAGLSVANLGKDYTFDFSTMNLTVPQSFAYLAGKEPSFRKLWCLLVYSLQISGSDVAFQKVEGKPSVDARLDALAGWSLENRKRSKGDPSMPPAELAGTDQELKAKLKTRWTQMAGGIVELSSEHRKAQSLAGLDKVWIYAPADPAKLTAFILTESAFLLKAYRNKPRTLIGDDLTFDTAIAYMMYNSTWIGGDKLMKTLISQAVRDAQILAKSKDAGGTAAMTSALRAELAALGGKHDFKSVAGWANQERWALLMNFMEKAGQDEWKPEFDGNSKLAGQVNASNFRTLSEFYKKVMDQP